MTLFTKIVNREIPAKIIYEDEHVLAFLDISQATKGHTLVIPKLETEDFISADSQTLLQVMEGTQKVAAILEEKLGAKGFNIISNAKDIAGQTVFHYHMHVIPRYDSEELKIDVRNEEHDLEAIYKAIID